MEVPFLPFWRFLCFVSLYSPYPPDIEFRRRAGPYIELYFTKPEDADKLEAACKKLDVEYERTTGAEAWYFNRLRELTIARLRSSAVAWRRRRRRA